MEVRLLEVESNKIMGEDNEVRQVSPQETAYTGIRSAWGFSSSVPSAGLQCCLVKIKKVFSYKRQHISVCQQVCKC